MYPMVVTLEMSKLSGWLNADASCRVEREAWEERGATCGAGRREGLGGGGASSAQGGPQLRRLLAGHARGAHSEHAIHDCDTGRVEAQRLVERDRALPSRSRSMRRGAACGVG